MAPCQPACSSQALGSHLWCLSLLFPLPPSCDPRVHFWHPTSPTYQESVCLPASLSPILGQVTIISHLNLTSASKWALDFLPCLGSISCLQSSQTTPVKLNIIVLCFLAWNLLMSSHQTWKKNLNFSPFLPKKSGPGVSLPHSPLTLLLTDELICPPWSSFWFCQVFILAGSFIWHPHPLGSHVTCPLLFTSQPKCHLLWCFP